MNTVGESNEQIASAVTKLMEQWTDTYKRKNQNYGNSWLLTGQILHLAFPEGIKLDSARKFIVVGLITRMLDKILRYAQLELSSTQDLVGEKSSESVLDLGVYAFMAGAHALGKQAINKLVFTKPEDATIYPDVKSVG